jgi:hypothetical protein
VSGPKEARKDNGKKELKQHALGKDSDAPTSPKKHKDSSSNRRTSQQQKKTALQQSSIRFCTLTATMLDKGYKVEDARKSKQHR